MGRRNPLIYDHTVDSALGAYDTQHLTDGYFANVVLGKTIVLSFKHYICVSTANGCREFLEDLFYYC